MATKKISLRSIPMIPRIEPGAIISDVIFSAAKMAGVYFQDGDILVIAHSIVSKAEGRVVHRGDVVVSQEAESIAARNGFDSVQVQLALQESKETLRDTGVLIVVMPNGLICNFAGVDKSNAPNDSYILLPSNPDESALRIRNELAARSGANLSVIISDTHGRAWRRGAINLAIGCSGINAFKHNKGRSDLHGRILKASMVCQVDEIASAVEPIMGQAGEGTPVVLVSGYDYSAGEEKAVDANRPAEENLFK